MRNYTKARWFALLPLMAITSVGLIAAARPAGRTTGCQIVAKWAQDHRASLPVTYGEMLRYPASYRKAIQAYLPRAVRREMWRSQFELYRNSGLLNETQKRSSWLLKRV